MATILNPVLTEIERQYPNNPPIKAPLVPFFSTVHRAYSLFQPIQQTKNKKSDFVAYLITPLIDYFILDTLFTIDLLIGVINALASLLKAAFLWTLYQQNSTQFTDKQVDKEWEDFNSNRTLVVSCAVALTFNSVLSTFALVTRPIASIWELMSGDGGLVSPTRIY